MKSIPTEYRGIIFRSRLEAKWAEFFDLLRIKWDYEPEGFESMGVRYLPDFWLPEVCSRGKVGGVFFEVKPSAPTEKETAKAMMLAEGSRRPVIVAESGPKPPDYEYLHEFVCVDPSEPNGKMWCDSGLVFARCECGAVDIGFYSGDQPPCPHCGGLFDHMDGRLTESRCDFQSLARWKRAA